MISKREITLIKSLRSQKQRGETRLFLVEGEKSLVEVLTSPWETKFALLTTSFLAKYPLFKNTVKSKIIETEPEILKRAGGLITNDSGIAVVHMPEASEYHERGDGLVIAVDDIQDPGNLGTLIRIADWYGIGEILLTDHSVDVFNPKVIQASMGSFTRVSVFYKDLEEVFSVKKIPVIGTFPEGENIYSCELPGTGYLLFGNESRGIRHELWRFIDLRVSIPRFGKAESLNIAVSAAVVIDHFMRGRI